MLPLHCVVYVAHAICGSTVWNWLHVPLLVHRILRWFLHLWKICRPLKKSVVFSELSIPEEYSAQTWVLTYSMQQSPSSEANQFSASQKFPAFYGTRRFITAFTSACHLSLFWASSIQSIHPHPTSCRSILIRHSHLGLVSQVISFPQVSPPKPCICLSSPPDALHALLISFSWFYHLNNIGWGVQIIKVLIM